MRLSPLQLLFFDSKNEPKNLVAHIISNNIMWVLKMRLSEIKNVIVQQPLQPAIISNVDSNHYLLGVQDSRGNFRCARSRNGKWLSFNSIKQAKDLLKLQGISYVIIQIQTAYNEMIGNSSSAQCQYNVDF